MKRIRLLILALMLTSLTSEAQDYEIPRFQISLSYFGETATHSGIRVGITTPIQQSTFGDENQKNRAWVIGGYLTYYKHPRNHKALMLTGSVGRQRISKNGFQTEINMETGYMLSILDGETFEWNGSEIVESSNNSSSHFVFGFNGGLGWNFAKNTDLPLSFMINPHLYIQTPYNTFLVPRVALETK